MPRKHCSTSTLKTISAVSLMRIAALLDGKVDDSLYISEEKIGIQRISMEMLDFRRGPTFFGRKGVRNQKTISADPMYSFVLE